MDVETFLTSLYVLVNDRWQETHRSAKPGPDRPCGSPKQKFLRWPSSRNSRAGVARATSGGSPTPTCALTSRTSFPTASSTAASGHWNPS
jgi:hypothetical protein